MSFNPEETEGDIDFSSSYSLREIPFKIAILCLAQRGHFVIAALAAMIGFSHQKRLHAVPLL